MRKCIIDTNALISFVTDRNPAQQDKITKLLDDAVLLKVRVLCPQNVLTEFIYVMDTVYGIRKTEIRDIVKDFVNLPGIEIVHRINPDDIDFRFPPEGHERDRWILFYTDNPFLPVPQPMRPPFFVAALITSLI